MQIRTEFNFTENTATKTKIVQLGMLWDTITWLEHTLYWTQIEVSEGKAEPTTL